MTLDEAAAHLAACIRRPYFIAIDHGDPRVVVPDVGELELSTIGDDRGCIVAIEHVIDGETRQARRARRRELDRIARALLDDDVASVVDPHGILGAPTRAASA